MNDPQTRCATAAGDSIGAYVAGRLNGDETEAFELHLLGCAECVSAVREAALLGTALRATSRDAARRPRQPARRGTYATIGLLAAATAGLFLLPQESALQRLGRVSAPAFDRLDVRSAPGDAAAIADSGVAAYAAARYATAARLLAAAAAADGAPGTSFLAGAAYLLDGEVEVARRHLTAALTPAGNPFGADAHFLLAKSWLAAGNADSALLHLDAAAALRGRAAGAAAALADSVRALGDQP